MSTIDEFRDAATNHFAWSRKVVWTSIAVGFLLFAGGWLSVQVIVPVGPAQYYALTGLTVGLIAVVVSAVFLGVWCNEGWSGTDPRLVCPQCSRSLQIYSELVIATGNCPRCGGRVLADWLAPAVVEQCDREPASIVPRRIERIDGRMSPLRLRLRRVMIVAAYVAVTLAMVLYHGGIGGGQSTDPSPSVLVFIPLVLCGLSALILVPGPHRDWIYNVFVVLQFAFCALSLAGFALTSIQIGGSILGGLLAVVSIVGVRGTFFHGGLFLIPRPCPECGRNALVHAAMQRPGMRTYHDYFWCLNCCERYKRLRSGPWEQAWSPSDDRFYWLWSSGQKSVEAGVSARG